MRKKILFIINPISGNKNKEKIIDNIKEYLNHSIFEHLILFTSYAKHAKTVVQENKNTFDIFVAVGGDGSINEIASELIHTNKIIGIIPAGSGNGLARHLQIPMDSKKAIEVINELHSTTIDTGLVNEHPFFCSAGIGFDSHISQLFATTKIRGLIGYIYHSFTQFINYQSKSYTIHFDKESIRQNYFLIGITNANQYGNNAYIAPQASLQDGYLDICLLHPFPKWKGLNLVIQLFRKKLHKSKYVKLIRTKKMTIEKQENEWIHLDGEALLLKGKIAVNIVPKSIQVLTPSSLSTC